MGFKKHVINNDNLEVYKVLKKDIDKAKDDIKKGLIPWCEVELSIGVNSLTKEQYYSMQECILIIAKIATGGGSYLELPLLGVSNNYSHTYFSQYSQTAPLTMYSYTLSFGSAGTTYFAELSRYIKDFS